MYVTESLVLLGLFEKGKSTRIKTCGGRILEGGS